MVAYDAQRFTPPAPVASVTLRDKQTGVALPNVPMLIDTGADVSLIPQRAVSQLGIAVDPKQGYQVMGFDGSPSHAQAVELDLIFLGRTIRGLYLILDQEVGILGRDVINHFALFLDGPNSSWDEK